MQRVTIRPRTYFRDFCDSDHCLAHFTEQNTPGRRELLGTVVGLACGAAAYSDSHTESHTECASESYPRLTS
jgi:hypothetical protein